MKSLDRLNIFDRREKGNNGKKDQPAGVRIVGRVTAAKPREKGLIITLFKLFTDIFTQNSMIKSHSSIYVHGANSKTLQIYRKAGCRWQHLIMGGGGVDHAH